MNRIDPLDRSEGQSDLVDVDPLGNSSERHPHRFLQKVDTAPEDDDGDGKAHRRIDPLLAGPDYREARDDNRD